MAEEIIKEDVKEEVTPEVTEEVKPKARKRKAKRSVPSGKAHILASFNNTMITFTDPVGNVLTYSSAGACGFKGSKKGTAYAAQVASEKASDSAKSQFGLNKADILIKGVGLGRDSAIRAIANAGIQVDSITDVTVIAHGGVRPRKARRV